MEQGNPQKTKVLPKTKTQITFGVQLAIAMICLSASFIFAILAVSTPTGNINNNNNSQNNNNGSSPNTNQNSNRNNNSNSSNVNQDINQPLGCCLKNTLDLEFGNESCSITAQNACSGIYDSWRENGICDIDPDYPTDIVCLYCNGQCSSRQTNINVNGTTLSFTALSVRNQLLTALKCTGNNIDNNGYLKCNTNIKANNNDQSCCRYTTLHIDNISFKSEGADDCKGGGYITENHQAGEPDTPVPGGYSFYGGTRCESLPNAAEIIASEGVMYAQSKPCTGGSDCGFRVTGSATALIKECGDECLIIGTYINLNKVCEPVEVSGNTLGIGYEYNVSLDAFLHQECRLN